MTEDWWFDSRQGKDIFIFPKPPDRLWGQFSCLFNWYIRLLRQGKKELEREADNPPSCRSELNNERRSTATNAYAFT
jgi:hypothetical protein